MFSDFVCVCVSHRVIFVFCVCGFFACVYGSVFVVVSVCVG